MKSNGGFMNYKRLLLLAILLVGCSLLKTPTKTTTGSSPLEPVEVHTELPIALEPEVSEAPVITPRYILVRPITYAKHLPRAEKFFNLALTDLTVINKSKFTSSDDGPAQIRVQIAKNYSVKVTTYTTFLATSKVIGHQSKGVIYLNTRKLRRPDCSIVNTLVHEYMHRIGYAHNGNDPGGNENSVPYWMGDRAEVLCEKGII